MIARDEYERRLVPVSDAEIIGLVKRIWADPALRSAFERTGLHGDLTDQELAALDSAIDAYRQGPLWDRDELHLMLAEGVIRRVVEGDFADCDDPAIAAFLEDRRVNRAGRGYIGKKASFQEIMAFAYALRADPEVWGVFKAAEAEGVEFLSDKPESGWEGIQNRFTFRYKRKYSLLDRGGLAIAIGHVRGVASGYHPSVDSPEFEAAVKATMKLYGEKIDD